MEAVKVGQAVWLPDIDQRGTVREIDPELLIARVGLITGGEKWEQLGDLEDVEQLAHSNRIGEQT